MEVKTLVKVCTKISQLCDESLLEIQYFQGDSGGGLYSYDLNLSKFIVVGITSYGKDCALPGYPGYILLS